MKENTQITINEFASKIGRSYMWVWHAIKLKKIEAEKIAGSWFIYESEIENFLRNPFEISCEERKIKTGEV